MTLRTNLDPSLSALVCDCCKNDIQRGTSYLIMQRMIRNTATTAMGAVMGHINQEKSAHLCVHCMMLFAQQLLPSGIFPGTSPPVYGTQPVPDGALVLVVRKEGSHGQGTPV